MRPHAVTGLGFSLLELLVALAVVGVMMSLSVPAISGISSSGNITRATDQVTAILDLARSEAISKSTYLWVGLKNETNNGSINLRLALVRSLDGSSDPSASNLRPVTKPIALENTKLVGLSDMAAALKSKVSGDIQSSAFVDMSTPGTTQSFSTANGTFTAFVLFTPQGEALVPQGAVTGVTTPFVPYIVISLRPVRGTQLLDSDVNGACIVVKGGSSEQQIYRL